MNYKRSNVCKRVTIKIIAPYKHHLSIDGTWCGLVHEVDLLVREN